MTLVVEDGTGKSDAESYCSVADATSYFSDRNSTPAAWSSASEAEKEAALRRATEWLDYRFSGRWRGTPTNPDSQALDWPRAYAYDDGGRMWPSDEMPIQLVRATAELAGRAASAELDPDLDSADATVKRERVKVGAIEQEVEYDGGKTSEDRFTRVEMLVAELVTPAGGLVRG